MEYLIVGGIVIVAIALISLIFKAEKDDYNKWLKSREECIKEGIKRSEGCKEDMMILEINSDRYYGRKDGEGKFYPIVSGSRIQISPREYRKVDLTGVDILKTSATDETYSLFLKNCTGHICGCGIYL